MHVKRYFILVVFIACFGEISPRVFYCGGRYSPSLNMLSFETPSIGSRGLYPPSVVCKWVFKPPLGDKGSIIFEYFDLERTENCNNDYLEIRKGRRDVSPLYGKYCGTDIPGMITIDGDIYVKFSSNDVDQRTGFRAHYRVGECYRDFSALEGRFATPNFPNKYVEALCEWKIRVPSGFRIRLEFKEFHIDGDNRSLCWSRGYYSPNTGMVIVREGLTRDDSRTLARYCGMYAPPVLSSGNELLVTFDAHETAWGGGTGFEAFYYAERPTCEERINIGQPAPSHSTLYPKIGNLTTHNYPHSYPANQDCIWVINSRERPLLLNFTDFDIGGDAACEDEYVEVRDGDTERAPEFGRYCGSKHPDQLMLSSGRHLYIRFKSGGDVQGHRGFQVEYEEGSFKYLNGSRGTISEMREEIKWKGYIQVPSGYQVYLKFPFFDMAYYTVDDHFYIYDGPSTKFPLIANYESTYAPPVLASGNSVTILYRKYRTGEGTGVIIKYEAVEPRCLEVLRAESGNITSIDPGSDNGDIDMCEWRIYSYTAPMVVIEVVVLDLMESENCNDEYLEITGSRLNSSVVDRFCGTVAPAVMTLENVFLKFLPRSQGPSGSFRLTYRPGCEYIYEGSDEGTIRIPTPEMLRHFYRPCLFNITVSEGNRISMYFTKFDIDMREYGFRTWKVVEIFDRQSMEPIAGFSARVQPNTMVSTGPMVTITINLLNNDADMELTYEAAEPNSIPPRCLVADMTITDDIEGYLTSPRYPDPYPRNQDCVWTVKVADTLSHLSQVLRFQDFDVGERDEDNECGDDFVEVYDGLTTSSRLLGRFCGSAEDLPELLVSRESALTIRFHSGDTGGGRGFEIKHSSDCHKVFEESKSVIQIDASGKWRADLCTYEINLGKHNGVVLDFTNLNIGRVSHYPLKRQPFYLAVKVGKSKDLVATLFYHYAPIMMVPNDVIYLEHRSSRHHRSSFNVTYYRTKVNCSKAIGNIELKRDRNTIHGRVVKRIAVPERCEWAVVNKCGGRVRLLAKHHYSQFFKRRFPEDGCSDFIESPDGIGQYGATGNKLCRSLQSNMASISTSDVLAVKYVAGANRTFTYFDTEYAIYCGVSHRGYTELTEVLNESWDTYGITSDTASWMAVLWDNIEREPFCSGILVSKRYIMTSATCITEAGRRSASGNLTQVMVKLGKTNLETDEEHEQVFFMNSSSCLPSLNGKVCLLRLSNDAHFSYHVSPVCLPPDKALKQVRASEGTYGFTMGWPRLYRNSSYQATLQRIPLLIKSWDECKDNVRDEWEYKKDYFCAGHVDGDNGEPRCYGHDGGPFLKLWRGRWYLYGIVANEWDTWGEEGCPRRGTYGWFWRFVKALQDVEYILCS
ncbi:cubilin-like isoform X1 [Ptychodera flava]|uniref:cubilin-like isoform X1 n=1 Tax=Ptychodera flava TaxID=63121 RepID=UPI00396A04BF